MAQRNNPPWQKTQMNLQQQQQMSLQQQMGLQSQLVGFQHNQIFAQQQQQQIPLLQLQNQLLQQSAQVQYPTRTSLNSIAFQQQPTQQQSNNQSTSVLQQHQQSSKFNSQQRVFSGTGVVSKVQNDIGFIDDEVLFHKNVCVKGLSPKTGDRVLVEAAYNQAMPFKWNATRVQVLPSQSSSNSRASANSPNSNNLPSKSSYNSVPPPSRDTSNNSNEMYRSRRNYSPAAPRKSPERRPRSRDRREAEMQEAERKRRRDEREKERNTTRKDTIEKRERSPIRKQSPKFRRARIVPRYMVLIPKITLTLKTADILELKKRYQNLYIPSDFFNTEIKWVDAFPANSPFSIQKTCSFHVMNKEISPLLPNESVLDPPDADYLFSAKVMLMSTPPINDIYKKCFAKAEDFDSERTEDTDRDFIHPTRLINFLVGLRGKNETMAIGGAWSKKLDGENPQNDPTVLIRTAIRTCKALTGIDLSGCTQWYRFVELYYRRSEQNHARGGVTPARVETVVIFLPDVRSCMPNRLEWETVSGNYKTALQTLLTNKLCVNDGDKKTPATIADNIADDSSASTIPVITISDDNDTAEPTVTTVPTIDNSSTNININSNNNSDAITIDEDAVVDDDDVVAVDDKSLEGDIDATADAALVVNPVSSNDKDESIADGVLNEDGTEQPTHFSQLDPKNMKVTELRVELNARNVSSKGLKNQLVARLAKALKTEADPTSNGADAEDDVEMIESDVAKDEEAEKIKEDVVGIIDENITEMDMSEVTVIDEYDSTKCEESPVDEKILAKKREEARKLDEKERHLLEKRYALPENPQIVVHPSRVAKNGKFDCTVMSLSLLLDYRPEDTKEHSFEVSLFAELFNEMLMRDFGFNIYKAITLFPSIKPKEEIKKDDKKDDKDKLVKPVVTEDIAEKLKAPESTEEKAPVVEEVSEKASEVESKEKIKPKEEETDKEKEKDRRREKEHERKRPVAGEKRRREDESDNDSFSNRSETESHRSGRSKREKADKAVEKAVEKVERIKYFTAFPDLLLSFVYFDQTNCGYMFEKDIEDLFYTLGLNLSRSQVRKIAEKFVTRDSLYYRRLCDRPVDVPFENPFENVSEEHLQKLAHGNQTSDGGKIEMRDKTTAADDDNDKVAANTSSDTVVTSGLVQFNGGLFDIKKLLEQMKRSEVARENTEKILVDLRLKNTELTTSNTRNNSKIKDLNSDLKSITRKLLDTDQNLSTTTRKQNEYLSALTTIHEKVHPIVAKNEKISRRETSRDQDKERERGGDRSDRGVDRKVKEDKIKEEKDFTLDSLVLKNDEIIIDEAIKEQATECVEI